MIKEKIPSVVLGPDETLTTYVPPPAERRRTPLAEQRPLPIHRRGSAVPPEVADRINANQRQARFDRYFKGLTWDGRALVRVGQVVRWCAAKVGWLVNWTHDSAVWLQVNAWKGSKFIRTHALLGVAPWTAWRRRKVCSTCPKRSGAWCMPRNKTCQCGTWAGSGIVHVTRLSDVDCPEGKWSKGVVARLWHGTWDWFRKVTGTRMESADGK